MTANDTAQTIIDSARRLLDEGGDKAVSMRKVAEQVGITAMAIYRHYPDHAALLNAVADQGFAELVQRIKALDLSGEAEERLRIISEAYLDFGLDNPRLFELMFLSRRPAARQFPKDFREGRSPTANLFAEVVRFGMESGAFREDDAWEITFEMGGFLQGLIMLHLGGRLDVSPAEFRAFYRRSFRRYLYGIHA